MKELIWLLIKLDYACVYAEHIGNEKVEGGEGNKEGNVIKDDNDDESADGLWSKWDDVFSSNVNDDDLQEDIEEKRKLKEVVDNEKE